MTYSGRSMSVLPIVDRELRVTARRPGTYWMRFWTVLAMLAIWLVLLTESRSIAPAQMGQHLLNALGILALVFSMHSGVFLTSDCLSEEKREGTLGLLFLTDLKAYDVVSGKFAANSLHAFFGLLAVFPILGLALLIGGVTGLEFARLMLVLAVTMFFSLSMGLVVSAMNREAKRAVTQAFLVVLVFAGLFPALRWFQWLLFGSGRLDFLLWFSPGYAYLEALDVFYKLRNGPREFWGALGTLFALGIGGIVVANVVLPRSWQEGTQERVGKARAKRRARFSKKVTPGFIGRLEPMYWLAVRDGSPQLMARRILMFLLPVWFLMMVASILLSSRTSRIDAFVTAMFTAYALHFIVKLLITMEAGRRMNQDRRSGAWELLLVTPLRVEAILKGQKRALRRHFLEAMLILGLINAVMMAVVWVFHKELDIQPRDRFMFWEMFLGGMLALATDFYALSWVGMWRGLRAIKYHRGVIGALGQVMLPAPLYFFFLMFLHPNGSDKMVRFVMATWFGLGVVVSLVSGGVAKRRLLKRFRSEVVGAHWTVEGSATERSSA